MTPESIIILNLLIYLFGFGILLSLRNTVLNEFSGWISLIINILGIISSSGINLNSDEQYHFAYPWLQIGDFELHFGFLLDNQSYFMYFLIQIIAFFIQLFSTKYLMDDPSINRFFAFINLFVFSMLGLVLSLNMIQLYVFWELVGFCSFLLIGFWYQKKSANSASIKAFLVNRLGDSLLMLGIFMIFYMYKTLDFEKIKGITSLVNSQSFVGINFSDWAMVLVFGGVMAKSAQIPLQNWLPDAMEGPTPASALIHAATMVVAGVFLLGRLNPLISPEVGFYIALIGGLTSVLAALSASFQYDIKKVLAYSTISQLGLMVAGMGMGAVGAALFHLATHAFFKAGLFLCAGAIIYFLHHEQDMRKMGNLSRKIPVIFYSYIIMALALIGVPFTSGFLSKEALLNVAVAYSFDSDGVLTFRIIIPILLCITTFLTAYYMIRQAIMVFFERQESPVEIIIDTTKKTVGKTIKSIQDILNADNENLGEDKVISFFRNLGVFELTVIALAIGSMFFVFSSTPLSFDEVWFLKVWGLPTAHFDWLVWVVSALLILALLVSYNTTSEELRRYYFNETYKGIQLKLSQLFAQHFYWDSIMKNSFFMIFSPNKPNSLTNILNLSDVRLVEKGIDKLKTGFLLMGQAALYFDQNLIDKLVLAIAGKLKELGKAIKNFQKGRVQLYLLSLVVVVLVVVVIKLFVIR